MVISIDYNKEMHPCLVSYTGGGRKGFTLAEVLVTLAVIGVVAALTIPSLMKNSEKQQWIAGYKNTYSIINQATRMVIADNGGTLLGAWNGAFDYQSMYNAYTPHLKIAKRCENTSMVGSCFGTNYTLMDGTPISPSAGTYSVILSNGTSVVFGPQEGAGSINNVNWIWVDTNGKKGPNTTGKDFHKIKITINSDPVKPDDSVLMDTGACPSDLSSGTGYTCGHRILRGDYGEDY